MASIFALIPTEGSGTVTTGQTDDIRPKYDGRMEYYSGVEPPPSDTRRVYYVEAPQADINFITSQSDVDEITTDSQVVTYFNDSPSVVAGTFSDISEVQRSVGASG